MSRPHKITIQTLHGMKSKGEKIVMLTAYDYQTAILEDRCGVDMILVGDTLGMVVLGYENTIPVTLEEIVHHLKPVARARSRAFLVGDLPFMSYQASVHDAVRNAGRLLKEGGAEAVKLEGGRRMEPVIRAILDADIPVMGHIGLTPQSLHRMGGYRIQGKDPASAEKLLEEALFLEAVGCFFHRPRGDYRGSLPRKSRSRSRSRPSGLVPDPIAMDRFLWSTTSSDWERSFPPGS